MSPQVTLLLPSLLHSRDSAQHRGLCPCPLGTGSARIEGRCSGVNKAITTPTPAPHACPGRSQSRCPCPLSAPSFSSFNDTRLGQRLTISCHSISGSGRGGVQRGIPGQGRGEPFSSPICCHLLSAQSCRSSRQTPPLWLTRGPCRVWGTAGHTAARAACPSPVSSAGTPHPAPGGSGPVLCPLVPLPRCWTGLTLRPALSLPLPEQPPPGWGEPTAGQGHHNPESLGLIGPALT